MDVNNDCTNLHRKNNDLSKNIVTTYMQELMLTDVFRACHPEKRSFTYTQWQPYTASRIDMFLMNHGLTSQIKSNITFATNTDHSLIEMTFLIE